MRNVEGAKAGSNQKKPYRAPVSVTSTQRMRIKYGISEGTIRGFSAEFSHNEMLKRIYLDGTPIMSAEGEQLLDVVVEFRDGSRDQEPINGLPSISVEHDVGVEVKIAAPVSRSFDRSDTTSYDVRISVPTLYQGDDEGNSNKGLIQFKIDVSTDGGAFEEAGRFDIYEKILNGFAETYNVVVPERSNHVVRISRLNSEVVSDYSVNRLVVEAITENTDVRLRYTNTAVLYLEYDAEQFSNVPKLEMRVFGKNDILVPANYNGDTHTYVTSGAGTTNGVWDGTWKRAYTDNPVWIALDLMISRRYGLGDKIDLTFINKWELYGLAQYCDEAVADGKGGFEPRFTCNNMYLQKSEDAYRVLKDLAASFRAKVVWDGEFITLQADVPRDPVHTFSNANASDITYSSTQDSAQRNLINVQYYDRDNKFASDVVMQRSNSNILSRGKVVDGNFTALGCASQGQAQRIASYVMNTELYETELVSFTTGLEGGLVRLNDVIQMADNSVAGQTVGGRIAAVNGRSITLDRKIPDNVQAIATTQLSINRQDVKNEPISIVSISDDRMTAVLASDAPAGTEAGLVWALLTQDLVPQKFVVTDIEFDSTNMTFAVSAIQYNESKYAAIDGSARIVVPPISVTEYKMLKAPIIVIASYLTRIIQDAVVCDIDVSWAQSTNAVQYQLEMQKAGSDWRIVGRFMSLATTLENMYTGTYTFRVCAYDSLGNASQYTYSDPILVAGKVLPPPMLAQYSVIGILFGYQHKWIYPAHTEDSRAVRLRFTTIDPVASPSQDWQYIDVAYPTANFTEQDVSANLRTWFSAAIVDKYGNVGAYTAWQSVVPSVDATQVLDLLDGQLTAQQLDQDLTNKIAIGAEAAEAAESAQNAADAAAQAAANAQTAANGASVAASNAQTTATTARTAASNAQTSANNAAASVNALATEVDADITALSTDLNTKFTTLGNGLTQETTDRQNADTQIVGQLDAYKTSNDAAVAGVLQKAEAATTASTANAQSLTSLTTTVNTKNRTYRQATAPTTGRVIGDLWINTTAGKNNEVRRWNGTAWDDLTDPRTAANATALTNLQTTVTAIDGRTTANANSITQLSTDLTTLSNNVDAKADASAVDSLTTRVSTAEGNITSQGTRVTNLENSVNHATTGLATKASSSALTATDSEVTRINGVVTGHATQLTQLASDITTINGNLATKADVSAVNALTTRVGNVEGGLSTQASDITTLSSKIDSRAGSASLIPDYLMANVNEWRSHYGYNLASYFVKVSDGKITNTVFRKPADVATCWNYSRTAVPNDRAYKLSMWVRRAEGSAGIVYFTCNLIGTDGVHDTAYTYTQVSKSVPATNEWTYVTQIWNLTGDKDTSPQLAFGFALNHQTAGAIAEMQGFKVEAVISTADTDSTLATADALTSTNTEVSRINGVVVAQGTSITNLQAGLTTANNNIATKADGTALTALTTRVSTAEGNITSQGTRVTNLENSVNHATTGLSTKASSAALTTLDNKVTAIDGRVTSNSSSITSLNNSLTTTNTNVTAAQTAATNAMTAAGQKGKVIFGTTVPVAADQLSQNLWIDTTGNANTPKRWNGTAWVVVTDKVATDALAAANAASSLAATKADSSALTALDSKVTTIDGKVTTNASNITTLQGKVTTVENGLATKADGSALSALTTRVTTAEGNITSQGTQLTNLASRMTTVEGTLSTKANATALTSLTTRVTNAETTLSTQATSITNLTAELTTLSIGGANLWSLQATGHYVGGVVTAPYAQVSVSGNVISYTNKAASSRIGCNVPLTSGQQVTIRFKPIEGVNDGVVYMRALTSTGAQADSQKTVTATLKDGYYTLTLPATRFPSTTASVNFGIGGAGTGTAVLSEVTVQYGNKATAWTDSYRDIPVIDLSGYATTAALSTLDAKVTNIDGRVTANATQLTQLNSSLTTTNNNVTAAQNAADAAALLAGSKGKVLVQTAAPAVADRLVQNLWIDITGDANTPKRWNGSAWVAVTDKVATDAATAAANALSVAQTKADASALTSLTTRVDTIDGKVTAQATQVTSLSTTVGNNTAAIQLQQSSIDGISAKATLQVEAGGVVGGVALGNNGGVVDVLIRSNTFAIAPPVSAGAGDAGKYMFQYRATPVTLPNGHVSPAGAYLGRASIDYIDATQIYATELSAITANLGRFVSTDAGGSTEIAGKEIIVKDPNGNIRVHIGIFT